MSTGQPRATTSRTRARVTVETNYPDSWPDAHKHCDTVLPRSLAGLPPCTASRTWRVRKQGRGYVATSYYCSDCLPDEYVRYIPDDEDDEGDA